nr:hypothetical protein [Alkalilimnicola ehrlichii]
MRIRMVAELMAGGDILFGKPGIGGEFGTREEERCRNLVARQNGEDAFRSLWCGAVVEGQCDPRLFRINAMDEISKELERASVGEVLDAV